MFGRADMGTVAIHTNLPGGRCIGMSPDRFGLIVAFQAEFRIPQNSQRKRTLVTGVALAILKGRVLNGVQEFPVWRSVRVMADRACRGNTIQMW